MKPPAWRLDRAAYPHSFHIQTRYRDEDGLHHVNNIAVAAYYDEARARFSRQVFSDAGGLNGLRIVTADSRVTYLGEVFHPDEIEIMSGILRLGTASYEIAQAMFQRGRCVGVCTTTFVQATAEGSSPLSPALREVLTTVMVSQPAPAA
jgi:acyl-CoA thioester hydrolase